MTRARIVFDWKTTALRLRHPWTIARGTSAAKINVLTRLRCGDVEGLGEAAPNARYGETAGSVAAALTTCAPLLGEDPSRLDEILDRIDAAWPGRLSARASIDIALHDWAGRSDGVPLWRLFGADPRRAPVTSMSIGLDDLEVMQEKVREASGFQVLKIKAGHADDRRIIEGIRRVTGVPLYIDANEGWPDVDTAAERIRWLAGMGVVLVEQPLPAGDLDGAKRLRDLVDLPIFADEAAVTLADLEPLAQAYDGINVKVQKAGGLRAARRMIAAARSLGMRVMLGCMIETSIGITAAAHLSPLADYADLDGNLLLADDPFRGARVSSGRLIPPDRPGLGIEGEFDSVEENTCGR
jgi:L-alanine-DL-glutamate epimerase-like enolase superfamily enzyme